MSYNNIFKILLILAIISTVCICVLKPQMHTSMLIYDSNYKLMETPAPQEPTLNMPTMTSEPQVEKTLFSPKQNTENINKITKIETPKFRNTKTTVTPRIQETKITNTPKTQSYKQPSSNSVTKKMTINEENIAWNKWRSNLQNQIMKDTKLPVIQQGTIFKFSFHVDLYGKITNVQTMAIPSTYTPYAIQYIAPVIRSYQGRSILNFPSGTARTETDVSGSWKISSQAKYSTPQDFNDTEKIHNYN